MGQILPKPELPALAVQGLETKKSANLQKSTRQSPEKQPTQRYTTLEELNAVLKNTALNKGFSSGTNVEVQPPRYGIGRDDLLGA